MKRRGTQVLEFFGLGDEDYLGAGSEASVYALDEDRVVRIVDPRTQRDYLERLVAFYRGIDRSALTLALPDVYELAELNGQLYTIEARLPGRDVMTVLNSLSGDVRDAAVREYMLASVALRNVSVEGRGYWRMLAPGPVHYERFSELLGAMIERSAARAPDAMFTDFPDWQGLVARWRRGARIIDEGTPRTLVHGDLFPGNVMCDESGRVTAIVDFCYLTVAGDWRMDAVSSLIFLEQVSTWTPRDTEVGRALISEHVGADFDVFEQVYRIFYALYFAGFALDGDPDLYVWCRAELEKWSAQGAMS